MAIQFIDDAYRSGQQRRASPGNDIKRSHKAHPWFGSWRTDDLSIMKSSCPEWRREETATSIKYTARTNHGGSHDADLDQPIAEWSPLRLGQPRRQQTADQQPSQPQACHGTPGTGISTAGRWGNNGHTVKQLLGMLDSGNKPEYRQQRLV